MSQEQVQKRGGPRVPGPGKVLGRPRKADGEKATKHQVYIQPWIWSAGIEIIQKLTGAEGESEGRTLANSMREFVLGGVWCFVCEGLATVCPCEDEEDNA